MAVIVIDGNNKHQLEGARLTKMVRLLIENAGEIVKSDRAQVLFDCAGNEVSASIKKPLGLPRPEA